MKKLAEILKNTPVSDLINAKPMKKKNFIWLHELDTVRTALVSFISHDIEGIPIKRFKENDAEKGIDKLSGCMPGAFESEDFAGMISLVNLLRFILSSDKETSVTELLDKQLFCLAKDENFVQKMEFVQPELSLMHLLLNVWGGNCNPKTNHIDYKHLLTTTQGGKYDIITPLDFLRHLLFLSISATTCLQTSSAADIENGINVDENLMAFWDEDVRSVVGRMVQTNASCLVAIVNEVTGTLEANLTCSDLLPKDSSILDESISMLRSQGISIHSYLQTVHTPISPKSAIDPILLYSHFSIYDLIEKLTRLRIHHLWRATPDSKKKPIGAVGVNDILRYLCFMLRPFMQERLPSNGQASIRNRLINI